MRCEDVRLYIEDYHDGELPGDLNIIDSPFYGYEIGYFIPTELEPGKGYWVKTNLSGIIKLNTSNKK